MKISVFTLGFALACSLVGCTKPTNAVPGFGTTQFMTSDISLSAPDAKADTLFIVDLSNMGKNLIWSIWLESIDGSLYPGLQSGLPSESLFVNLELSADKKFVHLFEKKTDPNDPRGANLVDRFPVVSLAADTVTFDFSKGLTRHFFRTFIQPNNPVEFNNLYSSVYNFENRDNVVTFAQLLKLNDAKASTVIMHHAFRLFEHSSDFKPVYLVQPAKMGIMPASFTADSESSEPIAIRKWDTRKPITFYISSNTPAEYRPSIIEGIKWWNEALGFEFIKIEVLTKPTNWADARLNIFQWSDDSSLCGGASAIGPSESNPVTGQIYSGKIIFCGNSFSPFFDKGIDPKTISREDFMNKLMMWSTAHEMGHVLGFTHNFKGKLYRDKNHPEILNSTVMDYPFPNEISAYSKVGPADIAKVSVAYLQNGDDSSVNTLKEYPFCSDHDASFKPDCTRFVPGRLTPVELSERYLTLLASKKPLVIMEHGVRAVILKLLFFSADESAIKHANELFEIYPGSNNTLTSDLATFAEAGRHHFNLLPENNQLSALQSVTSCILNCPYTLESRKTLLGVIGKSQTFVGYTTLQSLGISLDEAIKNTSNSQKLTDYYRLREAVTKFTNSFWE